MLHTLATILGVLVLIGLALALWPFIVAGSILLACGAALVGGLIVLAFAPVSFSLAVFGAVLAVAVIFKLAAIGRSGQPVPISSGSGKAIIAAGGAAVALLLLLILLSLPQQAAPLLILLAFLAFFYKKSRLNAEERRLRVPPRSVFRNR